MVTKQPEALRLADELEDSLYSADGTSLSLYCQGIADKSANELRRLHESNTELLAVLKLARSIIGHPDDVHTKMISDAITKAESTTT